MIDLSSVSLKLDGRTILHDISLSLTEKRIAILGSNGSGKSTFARLLNGLRLPTEGTVSVDGLDSRKEGRALRKKVGFVFQNPDNQIVYPIVEEDVAFGLKNLGLSRADQTAKIEAILALYDLAHLREHSSHTLSGGQKQLLAIAGVLVMEPDYVVMDEPTTLLDLRNKLRVARAIEALPQTAIVVTHDLDLIAGFDRVLVFDQGRVIIDDTPNPAIARYVEAMTDA